MRVVQLAGTPVHAAVRSSARMHAPFPVKYGLKPLERSAYELAPSSVQVPSQVTSPATSSYAGGWLAGRIHAVPYEMRVVHGAAASLDASVAASLLASA